MNICIYGASSDAIDPVYLSRVENLGETLAKRGHGLVFGAGAKGVMGAAARGFRKAGGPIKGVAPTFFNVDGVLFEHCTEFVPTETMRERKQIMESGDLGFRPGFYHATLLQNGHVCRKRFLSSFEIPTSSNIL